MTFAATATSRWSLLASLWSVYASFGLVAGSLAPLLERVRLDLGMSRAAIGAALGAWPFVYLFVAIRAGRILDRVGVRWGLVVGVAAIAASAVARSLAQGPVTLWLAVAVFGIGGPFVSIGAPKLVAEAFDEAERGRAVGIYSTAAPLGTALALVLAGPLNEATDSWRWVMVVFGGLSIAAGAGWLVVSRAAGLGPTSAGGSADPSLDLLADRTVRWVMVLAVGSFFVAHSLGGWMPEMLRTSGWSETGAAWLVAAGVLCGLVGSVVVPPLAHGRRRGPVLVLVLLVIALAVWPLLGEVRVAHVAVTLLLGVARVLLVPLSMLLLMSAPAVDAKRMGAAGGLFFTAGEIGGVSGPWITGVTRDLADDFRWSCLTLSIVAVGLTIAARQATRSESARAGIDAAT